MFMNINCKGQSEVLMLRIKDTMIFISAMLVKKDVRVLVRVLHVSCYCFWSCPAPGGGGGLCKAIGKGNREISYI
jgi:hypothetical protein